MHSKTARTAVNVTLLILMLFSWLPNTRAAAAPTASGAPAPQAVTRLSAYTPGWNAFGAGTDGTNVRALALDPSGNIYAGGDFGTVNGSLSAKRVAKWSGSAWSAMDTGNNFNSYVSALAYDTVNNLLFAGGNSTAGGPQRWEKWNGATWASAVGWVGVEPQAMLYKSGSVYAGGSFASLVDVDGSTTVTTNDMARWNGAHWTAMGAGMDTSAVYALAADNSGNIYAGGTFTQADGVVVNNVAKWNGTSWSALGAGVNGQVWSLATDSAGNLYAGGSFTTAGGSAAVRIAKWDGTNWTALGSGVTDTVFALAVDGSNNLYAGGLFTTAGGGAAARLAKWDGTTWSAVGGGTNAEVRALLFDNNGNLVVGGSFTTAGGVTVNHIAVYAFPQAATVTFGAAPTPTYPGGTFTGDYTAGNFTVSATANSSGAITYSKVSGPCAQVGTSAVFTPTGVGVCVVQANAAADSSYLPGSSTLSVSIKLAIAKGWNALNTTAGAADDDIYAVLTVGTNVYVGGHFSSIGGCSSGCNNIARWDGAAWSALGSGVSGTTWSNPTAVYTLALGPDGNIYAGGEFASASGCANCKGVAMWNTTNSTWNALGTGTLYATHALAFHPLTGNLYAGGEFTAAGACTSNSSGGCRRLAMWDGSAWSAVGDGVNNYNGGYVYSLAFTPTGQLYIGGGFNMVGYGNAVSARQIAMWDDGTGTWSNLGTGTTNQMHVLSLVYHNNILYAGGWFDGMDSVPGTYRLAQWDGTAWNAVAALPLYSSVESMAFNAAGDLLIGGFGFYSVEGCTIGCNNIARLDSITGSWEPLSGGLIGLPTGSSLSNIGVHSLAISDAGYVYAAGVFAIAGSVAANRVAAFRAPDPATVTFGSAPSSTYPGGAFTGDYTAGNFTVSATTDSDGGLSYSVYSGPCTQVGSSAVFTPTGVGVCVVQASAPGTSNFLPASNTQSIEIKIVPAAGWNALTTGLNFTPGNVGVNALVKIGTDLYVGGTFVSPGDCAIGCTGVAKWDGSGWTDLSGGLGDATGPRAGSPVVNALAVIGTDLYVGGEFTYAGIVTAHNIAKYDTLTGTWSALTVSGADLNGPVSALAVSDTNLYAAGLFTTAGACNSAAGCNNLAVWNGTAWTALVDSTTGSGGVNNQIYALAFSGASLYAGGAFSTAGGVAAANIAKWDGTHWTAVLDGTNASGLNNVVHALAVNGSSVYAGGEFTSAGGRAGTAYLARWDGPNWNSIDGGMSDIVTALAHDGTNLYASGEFLNAGATSAVRHTAVWNGYHWRSLSGGLDSRGLALLPSAEGLYVGGRQQYTGDFWKVNGISLWVSTPTTTSLDIYPAGSVKTGASVTLRATVTQEATGTVTFLRGGTPVTGCVDKALTVGIPNTAACTTTALPAGQADYTAVYTGSDTNSLSTSSAVSYTILKAAALNLTFSPVTSAGSGTEVTISAAVNSDATGTVAFKRGGAAISGCSAVAVTAGSAECKSSALALGSATYTAVYSGDSTYAAATSDNYTYTIKTASTTSLSISPAGSATEGAEVTLTATVTTGATGTVAFYRGLYTISGCTAVTVTAGSAECVTTSLAAGSDTYTAEYSGDTSYAASTSNGVTFVIKISSSTSLSITPAGSALVGDTVTLNAIISTGSPVPGARGPNASQNGGSTVAFTRNGTAIPGCSAVTVISFSAQCVTSSLASGTADYAAEYSGDSVFAASTSSAVSYTITSASVATTTTLVITPAQSGILYVNQIASFNVSVAPTSGTSTPTGTVKILQGAVELCSITLASGAGSCTYTFTTNGLKTLHAAYAGDTGFDASDSANQDITVRTRLIFPFLIFNQ